MPEAEKSILLGSPLSTVYNDAENKLRWVHDGGLVLACGRCGVQWFDDWYVPDEEWEEGRAGFDALCRPCFDLIEADDEIDRLQGLLAKTQANRRTQRKRAQRANKKVRALNAE